MIKQMVMEYIFMSMEPNMKDSGEMTYRMDTALKFGLMGLDMKDTIS